MITIRETGEVLPFGYANKKWRELRGMMVPGDRIFHFERREERFYMDGHVLVRDNCIIYLLMGAVS